MDDTECKDCVVEVLDKENGSWMTKSLRLKELERKISSSQQVCVVCVKKALKKNLAAEAEIPSRFARAKQLSGCEECCQRVSRIFAIPPTFWTLHYKRANGYFGCDNTYDSEDNFESHYTWFRFIVKQMLKQDQQTKDKKDYVWHKVNMFTRWWPTGRNIIISFETPPKLRMQFPAPILDGIDSSVTTDPYWIHIRFLEELVALHDHSIWSIRDLVRETERMRNPPVRPNPDYLRLHDIARHAAHSTETLRVVDKTIDSMIIQHAQFIIDQPSTNPKINIQYTQNRNRLLFYSQTLQNLKYRSEANRERLQNEITLAFHTVAQYDSKVSVQVGQAAQSDSAAMKTIAFLGLTFLPATYVCALFSMTFFNYTPGSQDQPPSWSVSDKFWIYFVVVVPLTAVTVALWLGWQRYFPVKVIGT